MTRTKAIRIRLSDAEHRQLKTLAGARGISALLRVRALGADRQEEKKEHLLVLAQLTRIRNILCQIARRFEGAPPADHVQILARLVSLEREVSKVEAR